MYNKAKCVFLETCKSEKIDFLGSQFCEIGLGTGFYTQILKDQHVTDYQGFDISDVVVPKLADRFPDFHFAQLKEKELGEGQPSLVVVPTSLLFNWQRESQKFTPALNVLLYHGGYVLHT